jgi:transglutaminase-like putative cysteine protease
MNKRVLAALVIVTAWIAGSAMLVRRQLFKPQIERLAEAALRVSPTAVFYAVMQGEKQVGFASSTVDTAETTIEQREYLVADVATGGRSQRVEARTTVQLTRTLRVRSFETSLERDNALSRVQGTISGDTLLSVVMNAAAGQPADTQRVRLTGPVILPSLIPLAVALESKPSVGRSYVMPLFDPSSAAPRETRIDVRADTLFVVNDSSVFDSTSMRWRGVLPDTVRAWKIVPDTVMSASEAWVDELGRLVSSRQLGFELRRAPYEVAFENWRRDVDAMPKTRTTSTVATTTRSRDIFEATAIASNQRPSVTMRQARFRLRGITRAGLDLVGGRQSMRGDTLTVQLEGSGTLAARYFRILGIQKGNDPTLKAEPFLEVDHREIVALAERLVDKYREPRLIVQQIHRWVYDSLKKQATVGVPSALHVLHTRAGDSNEHTQLFVALARAAGIPTRIVVGLLYVDRKFYYHAWPEVMLRDWVPVDPTFGQFPADAAHIRFLVGGLGRQTDLVRIMANLKIDVIGTQ